MSYNHHNGNRGRYSKKTPNKNRHGNRKPHWIYPNDLCWFEKTTLASVPDDDWTSMGCLERVMYSDEPCVYIRRAYENGAVVHHIESLGLRYVFKGPISAFTKHGPRKRPDYFC